MDYLNSAWDYVVANKEVVGLAALYVADKIVKATPTDKDDFVLDIVVGTIKRLFGKQ
jgi:hypothetical protein